jgi:quercetin dioxygenase-like cupin family protein
MSNPSSSYPVVPVEGKATRQVLVQNEALMIVEFNFEEGGVGALHSHPHVQSTFVKSGRFEFTAGDETRILQAGDALLIPSGVVHGCRPLDGPGTLVDSFTPRRDDFL